MGALCEQNVSLFLTWKSEIVNAVLGHFKGALLSDINPTSYVSWHNLRIKNVLVDIMITFQYGAPMIFVLRSSRKLPFWGQKKGARLKGGER